LYAEVPTFTNKLTNIGIITNPVNAALNGIHIMKYLFFIVIFFPYVAQASISLFGKGHVANTSIEMHLKINANGEAAGNYFYTKTNIPIELKGSLVEREITLETVNDPKIKEIFKGRVIFFEGEISRITGKWFGAHGGYGEDSEGYDFKVEGRTQSNMRRNGGSSRASI
jgi:hypothetical protein